MKYFQQLDMTDCGAACLAMISSYYGQNLNIEQIRENAGTDVTGTNINGILKAAKIHKLRAIGVKGKKESINTNLEVPFIAHLDIIRNDEDYINHYVVVKKITKKYIEIWDPDPLYKKQKLTYEKFLKYWTGYAIFCEPDVGFKKSKKKKIYY